MENSNPNYKRVYSPKKRKWNNNNPKKLEHILKRKESEKNTLKFIDHQLHKREEPIIKPLQKRTFTNRSLYLIIQLIIIIFILLENDLKCILTKKSADLIFSILVIIAIIYYIIEITLFSIMLEEYFLSYFFWLNILSIIVTIFDLHWIFNAILDSVGGGDAKNTPEEYAKIKWAKIQVSKRIIKIIKIIQIVRIVKLYDILKHLVKVFETKKEEKKMKHIIEEKKMKNILDGKKTDLKNKRISINRVIKEKPSESMESEGDISPLPKIKLSKGFSFKNFYETAKLESKKSLEEMSLIKNSEILEICINSGDDNRIQKTTIERDSNESNNQPIFRKKNEENKDEKKLSQILLNISIQKHMILIIIEIICFVLLNPSNYIEKKNSTEIGLKIFNEFTSENDDEFNYYFDFYLEKHNNIKTPIIFLKIGQKEYGNFDDIKKFRADEIVTYREKCTELNNDINTYNCYVVLDYTYLNKLVCLFNILKIILTSILLYFGILSISKDLSEMVFDPTDEMLERVKIYTDNPLEAIKEEEKKIVSKLINKRKNVQVLDEEKKNILLETELLEKTISKLGTLLAVFLGNAGAEIISQNMKEDSSGDVNPMIPGKKVCAIYGLCDIRNFTAITEILQEKVMVFVNDIAEIVHHTAFEYGGNANKNIGDAFLMVWTIDNKFTYTSKINNELKVYNCDQVNQICDMALISILKIFVAMEKSKEIKKIKNLEKIHDKFGKNAIKIGFGVNLGWSIEGAIGSNFKLDASYLSPTINMAFVSEEKTKEYGVDVVMTDKFVENLSEEAQKTVRILDIDNTGGEPVGYYTLDFDTENLSEDEMDENENDEESKNKSISEMKRFKRFKKMFQKTINYENATSIPVKKHFWKEFEGEKDWEKLRMDFNDEFYKYYNSGFDEFKFGDWSEAKQLLTRALKIKDDDKPTQRLLNIMKKYNYVRPDNLGKNL